MSKTMHAMAAFEDHQQHAAELSVLVAKIHAEPQDIAPVTEAFNRILDIAACAPGGQQALIDGLASCGRAVEVLAFCKMFVNIVAIEAGHPRHPFGGAYVQPVHDEEVVA